MTTNIPHGGGEREHLQPRSPQKITIANGEYQVATSVLCDSDDPKPLILPYLSKDRSPAT